MAEQSSDPPVPGTPTTLEQLSVSVDRRFEAVDRRFDAVDAAIVEQRQYTEFAFSTLKQDMVTVKQDVVGLKQDMVVVKSGLGRLERKLDQLIDGEPSGGEPEPDRSL